MDLTPYFTINLKCVPVQSDIPSNCEAYKLARAGTTLQLGFGKEGIYIPVATYRYLIEKHVIKLAESR